MFYIVIGQSGAGKTTYVREHFLEEPYTVEKGEIYYTKSANGIYALGKYGTGNRTDGTDTLSYSAKEAIKRQLKIFADRNVDVVLEGDRINNREIMEYISRLGVKAKMYLVVCGLGTSMRRLRAAGSKITPTFVKTTRTKSKNIFLEYATRFDGEVVENNMERDNTKPWKHE